VKIRVYYEDTDAGGVVYHSNYLNFCERARSEYFFRKDILPIINGGHFVVRRINCEFKLSAIFGDIIEVKTEILEIKKASFLLKQIIYKDEKELFEAIVTLVLVKDGKPQRVTSNIKDMLQSLFDKID